MNNDPNVMQSNVQPQMNTGGNVSMQQSQPVMQEQPAMQPMEEVPQQMDTQPMEETPQMESGGEVEGEAGKLVLNWGEVFTFFK